MRVLLGDNVIENCAAALVVNGAEVFRLRERASDGQLVVDFDVRGPNDERIATVAKNNVVQRSAGYEVLREPGVAAVKRSGSGDVLAQVQEIDRESVRITGEFWIKGFHVSISQSGMVAGGLTMSGCTIRGFGKAIRLDPGSVAIGCS